MQANVVHNNVHISGGQVNKNLGNCFLVIVLPNMTVMLGLVV